MGRREQETNQPGTPREGGAPVRVRFTRQCRNSLGVVFSPGQTIETFVGSRVLGGVPAAAYTIEDRAVQVAPRDRAMRPRGRSGR